MVQQYPKNIFLQYRWYYTAIHTSASSNSHSNAKLNSELRCVKAEWFPKCVAGGAVRCVDLFISKHMGSLNVLLRFVEIGIMYCF